MTKAGFEQACGVAALVAALTWNLFAADELVGFRGHPAFDAAVLQEPDA